MTPFSVRLKLADFMLLTEGFTVASTFIDDVDLVNGVIRQSNVSKTLILEMDLSNIFPHSIATSNIKSKLPLFNLLIKDGEDVDISCVHNSINMSGRERIEKVWYVSNAKSAFKFACSDSSKLSSTFKDNVVFDANVTKYTTEDNLLLHLDTLSRPDIQGKIKRVGDTFNSDKVILKITDTEYKMEIDSLDKRNAALIFKMPLTEVLGHTYEIQTKNDFMSSVGDRTVTSVNYYKPYIIDVDSTNPTMMVGNTYVVATCALSDTVKFTTYNNSRCYRGVIGDAGGGIVNAE